MDAVKLLTSDHRTVDRLFDRYEALERGAEKEKREVVEQIIRELSIHAAIEEQILYPGIRDVLPDGDSLADEAIQEHQEVKETLADLDRMKPSDPGFDAKVRSVITDVRHHAGEEEREMFPKLESAVPQDRLNEMGRRMEAAKMIAPTRPHPRAPATPPGNLVAGPMAAVVDRARDAVTGRGPKRSTTRRPARKRATGRPSARKETARKSTTRKRTTRKSTSRKSTARKSTGRKTGARKTTRRKTTARKSTGRKRTTSSRKSTSRKPSGRKTTSRKTTGRKRTGRKTSSRGTTGRKTTARKR